MKTYKGTIDSPMEWQVRIHDGERVRRLPLRLDIDNHSPTGFAWGYGGSGPAQLALALLADATGDDERAQKLHQRFKRRVVSRWDKDAPWSITDEEISRIAREIEEGINAMHD